VLPARIPLFSAEHPVIEVVERLRSELWAEVVGPAPDDGVEPPEDRIHVVAAERAHAERTAKASFETAVSEKLKDERARAEARRRAKEEAKDGTRGRRVAV